MSAFRVSPGVDINEFDLGAIIAAVAVTPAGFAGVFGWGPVGQITTISDENALVSRFGRPSNDNYEGWFSCASFLAYGSQLSISRAANTTGTSPEMTVTTETANATVLVTSTSNLSAGMIVISSSNSQVLIGSTVNSIINSTAFTLSSNSAALDDGVETVQFCTNTTFSAIANTADVASLASQVVKSQTDFTAKSIGDFDSDVMYIAKYPGARGNSLRVSVCGNSSGYSSNVNLGPGGGFISNTASANTGQYNGISFSMDVNSNTGTFTVLASSNALALSNATALRANFSNTDKLKLGNSLIGFQYLTITSLGTITGANASYGNSIYGSITIPVHFDEVLVLSANVSIVGPDSSGNTIPRYWEFFNSVGTAPGLSPYQVEFGNNSINNDEIHVVVIDNGGQFSGVPGTILEVFEGVSVATDARNLDGTQNYYKSVINDQSKYVWAINDISGLSSNTAIDLADSTLSIESLNFGMGRDGKSETNIEFGVIANAWDLFDNPSEIDVRYLITGKNNDFTLANYLMDNISNDRKDCITFISPERGHVVNNSGNEAAALIAFRQDLRYTSYGFMDTGYKLMPDRYNNVNRWVPLNGDMAGLTAQTSYLKDPWWSIAGYNRGQIKNVIKLAYNPNESDRNLLFPQDINPVISEVGAGTLLLGDKTLYGKNSGFSALGTRMLFIILEKAIATAAKFTLFEFNDDFTRAQFRAEINPFLRDIQGRRGMSRYDVICDASNNTPEVVQQFRFVASILVVPEYPIRFITLNFVAVGPTVSFSEIEGTGLF